MDEVSAVHGCQKTSYEKLRKNNILLLTTWKELPETKLSVRPHLVWSTPSLDHVAVSAKKHI